MRAETKQYKNPMANSWQYNNRQLNVVKYHKTKITSSLT